MSRIRTLKPEWLDDQRLLESSDRARLLSVGLILLADDYGNGRASPRYVGGRVFPGLDREDFITAAEDALAELEAIGYLILYEASGQRYYSIRNWAKHQRVDKPGKPLVPPPPEQVDPLRRVKSDRVAYFMRSQATGLIKIGESADPVARMVQLTAQSADVLDLLAVGGSERDLHRDLAKWRVHGEWFQPAAEVFAAARAHGFTGKPITTSRRSNVDPPANYPGATDEEEGEATGDHPGLTSNEAVESSGDYPALDSEGNRALSPEREAPENPSDSQRMPGIPSADRDMDQYQDQDQERDPEGDAREAARESGPDGPSPSNVRLVWDGYLEGFDARHPPPPEGEPDEAAESIPKLVDKRRALIRKRLAEHSVDSLVRAARGIWRSDWHFDKGETSIEHALASARNVDKFALIDRQATQRRARQRPSRPQGSPPPAGGVTGANGANGASANGAGDLEANRAAAKAAMAALDAAMTRGPIQ